MHLREERPSSSELEVAASLSTSCQKRLTKPNNPNLLSSERSKLYEEIVSTEDKILHEIQNRGPFKARPLKKKMFEARTSDSTIEK